MCNNNNDEGMVGSSMSYSKIAQWLYDEYGVPGACVFSSGRRFDQLKQQIRSVVREECRRAVEEEAIRLFRLADSHLPDHPEDGLYIPPCKIRINAGNVGNVKLRSFRGWRDDQRGAA